MLHMHSSCGLTKSFTEMHDFHRFCQACIAVNVYMNDRVK